MPRWLASIWLSLWTLACMGLAGCEPQPKSYPVVIEHGRGVVIRGIDAHDGNGVAFSARYGDGLRISDSSIRHFPKGGIALTRESNFLIENVVFEDCDYDSNLSFNGQWRESKVLDLWGCKNGTIRNCIFRHQQGGRSIVVWGGCENIVISGCLIEDIGRGEPNRADDGAIYVDKSFTKYGEPPTRGVTILNNVIRGYHKGIGVYVDGPNGDPNVTGTSFCREVRVINNDIDARVGVLMWAQQSIAGGNKFSKTTTPYGAVLQGAGNVIDGKVQ